MGFGRGLLLPAVQEDGSPAVDYSHLPSDVLRVIFAKLFGGRKGGWPVRAAFTQWVSIRLACKHWDEVLCGTPPPMDLLLTPMPETVLLNWLLRVPVRSLAAADWEEGSASGEEGGRQHAQQGLDPVEEGGRQIEEIGRQHAQQGLGPAALLSNRCMLLGMEGIGLDPFWSLAALQGLEELRVSSFEPTAFEPRIFDATPLQALPRLARLSLGRFTGFSLGELPGSVRELELCYDDLRQLTVPEIPQHLRLQALRVCKEGGIIGLCMEQLWDCCEEVAVVALQAMVGVPCSEARVKQFERPYREGIYVPPHILGDMEGLERSQEAAADSVSDFLSGAARSRALKALSFGGGSGASIKFLPTRVGQAAEELEFAFLNQPAELGMVRNINYLFSLTDSELQEWATDWLVKQRCLADEGEAPWPGKGDMGSVAVELHEQQIGQDLIDLDIGCMLAVVKVWREGDAGAPPPGAV